MAWISVHESVDGPKLRNLYKKLKCSKFEAIGILNFLWFWGLNNAEKDGLILYAEREDIERYLYGVGVGCDIPAKEIVDALFNCGWLDWTPLGISIHDWVMWQDQWYKAKEAREKDAERKRQSRRNNKPPEPEKPEKPDGTADSPGDGHTDTATGGGGEDGSLHSKRPPWAGHPCGHDLTGQTPGGHPERRGPGERHHSPDEQRQDGGFVTVECGYVTPTMARFIFLDCWDEGVMNEENTNKTGYYGSNARKHILEDILPQIAPEWRELMVPRKLSEVIDGKKVEYEDLMWLPSATDMFGPSNGRWWNDEPDSFQMEIFKRERERIKELGDKGTYPQWLRSVHAANSLNFCIVITGGGARSNCADRSFGFAPGFDIAAHDSE